jgi:hypothetical protein
MAESGLRLSVRRLLAVLIFVNLPAQFILLLVDLLPLRRRQLAAIERPFGTDFVIHSGFFRFDPGGLTCRERSGLHALRDAILLIFRALSDGRPLCGGQGHGKNARHCDAGKKFIHDFFSL